MTNNVSINKCFSYDEIEVYNSLKKAMELVPPSNIKDKVVLLKPNLLTPKKNATAVCTHPVVVAQAVKIFLELGAKKVLVGESPATHASTQSAKQTGLFDAIINAGGEWVDFSESVIVQNPDGKLVKSFEFAKPFLEADIVVSIAKLKTHQLMAYTGAMKNLFGLMVGLKKAQSHFRFSERKEFSEFLTDLCIAAKPQYAIMDAIVGMEGPGGPGNGTPVQLNFLAASDNILALDWVCSSIVGYDPHLIVNLQDALERGIWLKNEKDICILGESIESVKPKSFKIVNQTTINVELRKHVPSFLYKLIEMGMVKTPRFVHKKCVRCGKCVEICPAKILTIDKKVLIDKPKCLHCFCCHEVCPVDAIKLKRF